MLVPKIEKTIGIEVYATRSSGIGGVIRQNIDDFIVEEVLVDGSKAETKKGKNYIAHDVLGTSAVRNDHLLCVLVKRNWDTLIALRNIARQLGIKTSQIQTAGIKDAKAITAQHISIDGVPMKDVQKVHIKDIEILPIGYLHSRLSSYYLLGNSFQTTIRSVNHPKSTIQRRITETVQELQTIGGVPNFFGHQRFGTARPTTHLTGKAIIKGNLRKAAMIYLAKPSPYEHPESRQARKQLKDTQDFKQAFKDFPQQLRYERLMLEHLVKKSNDFAGAFRRLPIKLRELFIQACQSYLFNRFLSRRVEKEIPLNAAEVGDYVVSVEHSGLPMVRMYKTVSAGTRKEINATINNGKMRLAIPLTGFKQRPSQGLQGEIEKQVLNEEDVSPQDFKAVALPETSERGTLRTAITSLNNFSVNQIMQDSTNPPKHSVRLSFMLLRASYATVLLRELIKPRNITKAGF